MVYHHSLKLRIIKAFFIFGTLLSLFYALFIYFTLFYLEEYLEKNFYQKRVEGELNFFLKQYQEDKNIRLPASPYLSVYMDPASMPEAMQRMVKGRPDGLYEIEDVLGGKKNEYNFIIHTIPETGQTVYLFYDAGFLEITDQRMSMIMVVLAVGFILVLCISIWIGVVISGRVIAPVIELADIVQKTDPDKLPTDLSKSFQHDEVGILAVSLEQAMRRIQLFIQREQQFTRNASHELRTPVTIIKGAVELLKQIPEIQKTTARHPVLRIERSVLEMERIIDSFLWLAREKDAVQSNENCSIEKLLQETINQHQYLIENKSLQIESVVEADLNITAPASLLKIVFNNLIKNTFQYTTSGKITVIVKADRVIIEDTGIGISSEVLNKVTEPYVRGKESQGFGIGLSIVKMICERFDWQLDIQSKTGNGTAVQLIFSKGIKAHNPNPFFDRTPILPIVIIQ